MKRKTILLMAVLLVLLVACLALAGCSGAAVVEGEAAEQSETAKSFTEDVLPNIISFASSLLGALLALALLIKKFIDFAKLVKDLLSKSDSDYNSLKQDYDNLKTELNETRLMVTDFTNEVKGVVSDAKQTKEMCLLAFTNNNELVSSGTARQIAKVVKTDDGE